MDTSDAAELLRAKQVALFCGAGISQDPPAGLPDWHDLRDLTIAAVAERSPTTAAYVTRLTATEMLAQAGKRGMTPELVASVLADATPAYFDCLRALHDGEPNANHESVAALAAHGHLQYIITTNFDTFLEEALEKRGVPVRVHRIDEDFAAFTPGGEGVHLLKIHGCITVPPTITATVEQEGGGLRPPIRSALERLLTSHWWLFWGYSGADLKIDLDYLGMVSLVDRARGFFWSCFRAGDYEEAPHPLVVELAGRYGARALVAANLAPDAIDRLLPDRRLSGAATAAVEDGLAWRSAKRSRLAAALNAWAAQAITPLLACSTVGSLLNVEGAHAEALVCFRRMRELAQELGSLEAECQANVLSGSMLRNHGEFVDAYADLKIAEQQARTLGAWPAVYTALFELGSLYDAWGRSTDALNVWLEAEALVREAFAETDDTAAILPLDLHEALARAYLRLGYGKQFLAQIDIVEQVTRQTGDERGLLRVLNLRMVSQLEFGEWAAAAATGEEWYALVRTLGYRRDIPYVLVNLAMAHMMTIGNERARADLEEVGRLTELEPSAHLDISIAMLSASLLAREGRHDEARHSLQAAIELGRGRRDDYQTALALSSVVTMTQGTTMTTAQRVELLSEVLEVLERCGDVQRAAMVAEEIGDLQAGIPGLDQNAVTSYRRAMASWRLRNIPDRMPELQEKLQRCASRASGRPLPTVVELLRDAASSREVADLLADDARKRVSVEAATLEELATSLEQEFGAGAGAALMQRLHQAGVWAGEDGKARLAAQYHGAAYRMALKVWDLQSAGVQLNELAVLAAREHAYVAAKQLYEQSLALARETGNRREQVTTMINLGVLAERQERLDDAVAIFERAAVAAEADQLLYETAVVAAHIGLVRRNQRRFDDARAWLQRAEAGFRRIGATSDLPEVLIGLGKTYRELGEPLESVHARIEAARLLEADGQADSAAPFYLLAGNSLLKDLQQPQEAKRWLEAALAIFDRVQMREQAAQARGLLAECGAG